MDNQSDADDPDEFLLMTVDELIDALANRGVRLRSFRNDRGNRVLTDGTRRYTLPRLPGEMLTASQVGSLLRFFAGEATANLLRFELHLDPGPED